MQKDCVVFVLQRLACWRINIASLCLSSAAFEAGKVADLPQPSLYFA